jgi:LysR family transcriptional regulator, transcription activator of glutamate synthase operon
MELHQLQYFIAIAEHGHFTRAAASLHVAQPSVSQQIRKLETELGAQLFHRLKRRVTLTEAGEALLPWARRIVSNIDAARTDVQELSNLERGRISIGATPSIGTHFLPATVAEFHRTHPGITFVLREAGSRILSSALEAGELDLALLILPVAQLAIETEMLIEEPILVAVPPDHPLSGRTSVRISDLRDEPFVLYRDGYDLREVTLSACHQAGFQPQVSLDGGEMDSVARFVNAGMGVALVPAMAFGSDERTGIPIREPGLTRSIGVAYRRERKLSAGTRAFIELLRERVTGRGE